MSKKPRKDGRKPDGKFDKGNTAGIVTQFGVGNDASKGHGRPPDRVKAALTELLDGVSDGDVPLCIEAITTLRTALRSKDSAGNPTMVAVAAASKIIEHRWGKPKQTTEVNISNTQTIETVRKVLVGIVASDARAAIEEGRKT